MFERIKVWWTGLFSVVPSTETTPDPMDQYTSLLDRVHVHTGSKPVVKEIRTDDTNVHIENLRQDRMHERLDSHTYKMKE